MPFILFIVGRDFPTAQPWFPPSRRTSPSMLSCALKAVWLALCALGRCESGAGVDVSLTLCDRRNCRNMVRAVVSGKGDQYLLAADIVLRGARRPGRDLVLE